jgi:hypothetical protein
MYSFVTRPVLLAGKRAEVALRNLADILASNEESLKRLTCRAYQ